MTVEDQLRAALRRKAPPAGFAARVVSQAAGEPRSRQVSAPTPLIRAGSKRPRWVALGVAASLVLATGSGLVFLDRQKAIEARRARALAIEALRVANTELNHIQSRVTSGADRGRAEHE
jgi:hypothetical protein